jgi:PIN domain nuclease of toxin-antitoxin system
MDGAVDAGEPLFLSPISAWEIGNLARKGRFDYPHAPQVWLEQLRAMPGVEFCELSPGILLGSSFLPGTLGTKDPADRIIAATAREFGYTVMTRDESLLDYGRQGHLSVLEC